MNLLVGPMAIYPNRVNFSYVCSQCSDDMTWLPRVKSIEWRVLLMENSHMCATKLSFEVGGYWLWLNLERDRLHQVYLPYRHYACMNTSPAFQARYVDWTSQLLSCTVTLRLYLAMGLMTMTNKCSMCFTPDHSRTNCSQCHSKKLGPGLISWMIS